MDRSRRGEQSMHVAASAGVLLGALSLSSSALAYRPFDSTDADVAKVGELELEIGPVGYLRTEDRVVIAPAIIANAGILERCELVLEGKNRIRTTPTPEPRDELGDAALSLKVMLREGSLQDKSGLSVATELGSLLPATGPDTGFGASAALIVSQRDRIGAAHLNGGVFLGRAHHPGTFAGVILEGPFEWTVRPVVEGFFEREFEVETIGTGLVGFIWRARENLSIDGALRAGRASDTALVEVRAGLTWGFDL
jgi:hypothetical protein